MKKTSVLPSGMTLAGDIEGDEDLVVLGRVEGTIQLDGALVIESGGAVRGDVRARTVTVRGILVGDAHADETIWVEDGARLVGDLVGPRVKVMDGARFRGHVRVLSPERPGPVVVPPPRRPSSAPAPAIAVEAPAARAVEPTAEPAVEPAAHATAERFVEAAEPVLPPEPSRRRAPERKRAPLPTMPAIGRTTARRRLDARG
jgi:cytoskeletal protein CcmA (bactofilin family)